jgi:DNA-binding transcriptional LysR family regulator
MELRQLQMFIALAEEMQFTRAANRMNIVRSGLSTSIKDLENELGTRLFERSTRRVVLTEAGKILLEHVRTGLSNIDKAVYAVQSLKGITRGRLNIGILECLPPSVRLPALFRQFRESFPEVELHVETVTNDSVPSLVSSGKLDISFYSPVDQSPFPNLRIEQFAVDSLVAICAKDHTFASQNSVQIEALKEELFIDLTPERHLKKLTNRIFAQHGLNRTTILAVDELRMMVQLVGEGMGIAIAPACFAKKFSDEHVIHRLQITSQVSLPKLNYAIISRSNPANTNAKSKLVDLFFEMLNKYPEHLNVPKSHLKPVGVCELDPSR